MNTMKYAKYHLSKSWISLAVMIIATILMSIGVVSSYESYYMFDTEDNIRYIFNISSVSTVLMAIACALPLIEFRRFKNKRNLDTLYSLPISRGTLFVVHFLEGLVFLTISLLASLIVTLPQVASVPGRLGWSVPSLLGYYALELGVVYSTYMIMTLGFVVCNSERDGIFCELAYLICPMIAMSFLAEIIGACLYGKSLYSEKHWEDLRVIERFTSGLTLLRKNGEVEEWAYLAVKGDSVKFEWIPYLIVLVIGLISLALAYYKFTRSKAEECGDVTKSLLAFDVLIPATFLIFMLTVFNQRLVKLCVMPVMFIIFVIQHKGVRLGKVKYIMLAVFLVLAIVEFDMPWSEVLF